MTVRVMFQPHTNNLIISLVVVIFFHAFAILAVKFSVNNDENKNEPIIINMINNPEIDRPKQAEYLAQQNEMGSASQLSKPVAPKKEANYKKSTKVSSAKKNSNAYKSPSSKKKIAPQKSVSKVKSVEHKPEIIEPSKEVSHLSAESLQQQISQLGAEIRESQVPAEQTKIKFVDSVSTHKYIAAQYIKDWENKVERTGNLNFPSVAAKKNFSGSLILDVGIKSDGSIYSIRVNKSSGIPGLDEAAKNIVRISAPFPPLPIELAKELDVFVITRVWTFTDETGLVTR